MRRPLPLQALRAARSSLGRAVVASGVLLVGRSAHADPPLPSATHRPYAYALVVGSNAGGAGQQPLHFAQADAARFAQVLREIGRYEPGNVRVLLDPDRAEVVGALDDLGARVRANAGRGEPVEVVFYYSGHARASAVSLGGDELPLIVLRDRLSALPSALTIVVLDACQSGAFTRVKGAEPAADFTYNSVAGLTQKGLAIMASSTSQELSQESDELKASYFTHHLVTGLRGAADGDHDGRVSLDEAYRYAYRRTLASTARTQVGVQHVTLETDLAGQGDVAMTYPVEARAQLELPGPLDGRVLLQHRPSGAVVAEVQKAAGPPVRLAFAAGSYEATIGQAGRVLVCRVELTNDRVTLLEAGGCAPAAPETGQSKGDSRERATREVDRWSIDGSAGFIGRQTDAFTDRLHAFGYQSKNGFFGLPSPRLTLGVTRAFAPHIAGVLEVGTLAGDTYERSIAGSTDTASFAAYRAAAEVRVSTDVLGRWLGVYGQAGVGMSLGVLTYDTAQSSVPRSTTTTYPGYVLGGAVGVTARFRRIVTLLLQAGYDRAPAIHDLTGDTHDSGGPSAVLGLRFRVGEGP